MTTEKRWSQSTEALRPEIKHAAHELGAIILESKSDEIWKVDERRNTVMLKFRRNIECGIDEIYEQECSYRTLKKKGKRQHISYAVTNLVSLFRGTPFLDRIPPISSFRKKIFRILFQTPRENLSEKGLKIESTQHDCMMSYGEIALDLFILDRSGEQKRSLKNFKILKECGADIHGRGHHGENFLSVACQFESWDIVSYLIDCGVRGDVNADEKRKNGGSAGESFLEAVSMKMRSDKRALSILERLIKVTPDTNLNIKEPVSGGTVLVDACYYENVVMVKWLVKHGADVNGKSGEDETTPLIAAMWAENEKERDALCQILVGAGADPWLCDRFGRSAVSHALSGSLHASPSFLENLLSIPLRVVPDDQQIVILFSAMYDEVDSLEWMMRAGLEFNINARYRGRTLLHEAARAGETFRSLLNYHRLPKFDKLSFSSS